MSSTERIPTIARRVAFYRMPRNRWDSLFGRLSLIDDKPLYWMFGVSGSMIGLCRWVNWKMCKASQQLVEDNCYWFHNWA